MNVDRKLLGPISSRPDGQSLFDTLAHLVPEQRRAEYYRVLAHTRTLSPDDEMLRILEAMGLLAALTRETPAEIAAERKCLEELLQNVMRHANEIEERMLRYTANLDSRIVQLPDELEAGLDPERIAKMLGESLRQHFLQSGLPETARALSINCLQMKETQKLLEDVLEQLCHPERGVFARVTDANQSLSHALETRAGMVDSLLIRQERNVWRVWLPIIASAALVLGLFLGNHFGSSRHTNSDPVISAQTSQRNRLLVTKSRRRDCISDLSWRQRLENEGKRI